MLPSAWQALCKTIGTSGQGHLDALRSISIHAASQRAARLPSLAWMTPLLNLGQQSGPRLMAVWHTCMRKVNTSNFPGGSTSLKAVRMAANGMIMSALCKPNQTAGLCEHVLVAQPLQYHTLLFVWSWFSRSPEWVDRVLAPCSHAATSARNCKICSSSRFHQRQGFLAWAGASGPEHFVPESSISSRASRIFLPKALVLVAGVGHASQAHRESAAQ